MSLQSTTATQTLSTSSFKMNDLNDLAIELTKKIESALVYAFAPQISMNDDGSTSSQTNGNSRLPPSTYHIRETILQTLANHVTHLNVKIESSDVGTYDLSESTKKAIYDEQMRKAALYLAEELLKDKEISHYYTYENANKDGFALYRTQYFVVPVLKLGNLEKRN
jgi:hypothetical protein